MKQETRATKVRAANTGEAYSAAPQTALAAPAGTASARGQMLGARLFLTGLALIVVL